MFKVIEIDQHIKSDRLHVFEPTLRIIHPGEMIKTASPAFEFAQSVKPIEGKTIILVIALGAGEYYGENRNGDFFTQQDLINKHKTFESGHVFRHHVNKDPNNSYGSILHSFWNDLMKRVELLLALDNCKCSDVIQNINQGKPVATSMGCKVPYDICSICGNKAKKKEEYCDHIQWQLKDILPDGRKVCMINPDPNFFDESLVFKPADETAYALKKVAAIFEVKLSAVEGERVESINEKLSFLNKLSLIDKIIFGESTENLGSISDKELTLLNLFKDKFLPNILKKVPIFTKMLLDKLLEFEPIEVFSTLTKMGIFLTTPEFLYYYLKETKNQDSSLEDIQKLIQQQDQYYEYLKENPEEMQEMKLDDNTFNNDIADLVFPFQEKRSVFKLFEKKAMMDLSIPVSKQEDIPMTQELSYTDPDTGEKFHTNLMEKNIATEREELDQGLKTGLGALAALTAYKTLGGQKWVTPLIGSAMIGKGISAYTKPEGFLSDEGIELPSNTRMVKESSYIDSNLRIMIVLGLDRKF